MDYSKPVARKKPDTVIIHTGTNDLTDGVKTEKGEEPSSIYQREW